MKKHSKSALIVVAIALVFAFIYFVFSNGAEEKIAPAVVQEEVCDILAKLPDKNGYEKEVNGNHAVYTKVLTAPDGQMFGHLKHTFILDKEKCTAVEAITEKEVNGEKLVNYILDGRSEYYKNNTLIYTDTALKNGYWEREYSTLENIPEKIPNWLTVAGEDLYMTWLFVGNDSAMRVPFWSFKGIWQKSSDKGYTLMAGQVAMKNPNKGLVPDELYTFVRYDKAGVVNYRGILFPSSTQTYDRYLKFMKDEETSWQKDAEGDIVASDFFFSGPIKLSKKKKTPLEKAWDYRGTETSTDVPTVPKGFTPATDLLPKLDL